MNKAKLTLLILITFSAISIVAIHLFWPGLRFEYWPLNYLVFAVAHLSLPIFLLLLAFSSIRQRVRTTLIILAGILMLPTGILAFSALTQVASFTHYNADPTLYMVASLERDGTYYRLYRTKANPDKAHSLILRREKPQFFGLKRVDDVKGFYGAQDGTLIELQNGRGQVTTNPYNSYHKAVVFEFRL